MFPLGDSTPRNTFPIVNYWIIGVCIFAFFLQLSGPDFDAFVFTYGFVPSRFSFVDPSSYFNILSSMFLHGGWFHIASNLWFLHIFGDNVEDRMGHLKYLVFYLLSGFAATFLQLFVTTDPSIPMIGASGAISGVIGAYFVFFRHSRIKSLVSTIFTFNIVELPAWFFLGYWFVIQLFSGAGSLVTYQEGGVAWFAHIGGFMFGFIVSKMIRSTRLS